MKVIHVSTCYQFTSSYNLSTVVFQRAVWLDSVIANNFSVLHFSVKWFFIIVYLETSK